MKRILAGPGAVESALQSEKNQVTAIYTTKNSSSKRNASLLKLAQNKGIYSEQKSKQSMSQMARGLKHQNILAVTGSYSYVNLDEIIKEGKKRKNPLIVLTDQIQDPQNLGAVIRSSHCFGALGIVLCKNNSAKVTGACVRASAGSSELIKIARVTNLAMAIKQLKDEFYEVSGAHMTGNWSVFQLPVTGNRAIVLGNEGSGLRHLTKEHCDNLFYIPMSAKFDSLNVSAVAAIALYQSLCVNISQ